MKCRVAARYAGFLGFAWIGSGRLGLRILEFGLWMCEWRRGRGGGLPPPRPRSHELVSLDVSLTNDRQFGFPAR